LGWAFKKDTNDTRESAAIYVAEHLIEYGAQIHVYDSKVSEAKIKSDMRYLWELNGLTEQKIVSKINKFLFTKRQWRLWIKLIQLQY
jgi:UDPglucose 6-dehydrogenase